MYIFVLGLLTRAIFITNTRIGHGTSLWLVWLCSWMLIFFRMCDVTEKRSAITRSDGVRNSSSCARWALTRPPGFWTLVTSGYLFAKYVCHRLFWPYNRDLTRSCRMFAGVEGRTQLSKTRVYRRQSGRIGWCRTEFEALSAGRIRHPASPAGQLHAPDIRVHEHVGRRHTVQSVSVFSRRRFSRITMTANIPR